MTIFDFRPFSRQRPSCQCCSIMRERSLSSCLAIWRDYDQDLTEDRERDPLSIVKYGENDMTEMTFLYFDLTWSFETLLTLLIIILISLLSSWVLKSLDSGLLISFVLTLTLSVIVLTQTESLVMALTCLLTMGLSLISDSGHVRV